jgi:Predicted enolase-phosphatase
MSLMIGLFLVMLVNETKSKNIRISYKKFNLIPEETLFIDDKIENTDSAAKLGIKTIQLTNPKMLTQLIKKYV